MLKFKNKEDLYLLSTVRIEADTKDGVSTGTGFICSLTDSRYGDLTKIHYLVTNKHVIKDGTKMTLEMHTLDSDLKKTGSSGIQISLDKQRKISIEKELNELFFFHPKDDVDIAILNLNINIFRDFLPLVIPVEIDKVIPEEDADDIEIYDDVIFIGYPNGLYDKKNLLPIIRKGSFATPYQVDFDGHPIFLIDASVFPGSSGSPVFLFDRKKTMFQGVKMDLTEPRIYFLGIVARVYQKSEFFDLLEVKDIKAYGKQMIDIGVVYKAAEIKKLIKFYLASEFLKRLNNDQFEVNEIDKESEIDKLIISALEIKEKAKGLLDSSKNLTSDYGVNL